MENKRKLMLAMIAVSCAAIVGIFGLMASAEAAGLVSTGNIVGDDGQVSFYGSDVAYLNREIGSLRSEIDYSVFGNAAAGGNVSLLTDRWRDSLSSRGVINYDGGKVAAGEADIINLADDIDALGNDYAAMTCRALNMIGTFFDADGNINHESQTTESIALSCRQLAAGISESQSVDHLAAAPVTEENITAGAAAWVNGRCIIGNGGDNERSYKRGVEDGGKGDGDVDGIDIEYTRHAHTGNGESGWPGETVLYQTEDPGGCFVGGGHTHNATGTCEESTEYEYCNCTTHVIKRHWHDDEAGYTNCYFCEKCGNHKGRTKPANVPCIVIINTTTTWECGSPANTWEIGCGRETGDIESATVIVHKNHETRE